MSTISDDVRRRVPAALLRDIEDLTGLAIAADALVAELGKRYRRLWDAYHEDADYRYGDRPRPEGEHPEDWDRNLEEACGLGKLGTALGAIKARIPDYVPDADWCLQEHGFTGFGITE